MAHPWLKDTCIYGGYGLAIRNCAECGAGLCINCGICEGQKYYCYRCYPVAYGRKKNGPSGKRPFVTSY